MGYLFLLIPVLTASAAQIFLKKGILKLGNLDISLPNILNLISLFFKNGLLVTGAILYGISLFSYLFALSNLQLNIVYPVAVSCVITLVFLASRFLFRESLTLYQILGIIVIISGIFLLVTK